MRFVRTSLVLSMLALVGLAAAEESPLSTDRFIGNARQLTFEGERAGEGYFSPDGKKLIFQSERQSDNPFFQIYILNLETGDTHRVSPGQGKTTCSYFVPGTDKVIYASTQHDPRSKEYQEAEFEKRRTGKTDRYDWDYDPQYEVYMADEKGGNYRNLTNTLGYDAECAASPYRKQIVFSSNRHAFPNDKLSKEDQKRFEINPQSFLDIYIMNADGSNVRRLTSEDGYDGGPFFTPDGERVVWRHFNVEGNIADVYTIRTDGTDKKRLTDFESMSWAPYFHPSGKYAIFNSNKLGFSNFELFIVDAEGKHEPVRVSFFDKFDGLAVFSPDGNKLAWTTNRTSTGKGQLFYADWNHEAALEALGLASVKPPKDANITAKDMTEEVKFLASDDLEGRMTGSQGARTAADYIAECFKQAGLKPAGDNGTYLQSVEFTAGVEPVADKTKLGWRATTGEGMAGGDVDMSSGDFSPLAPSANGTVEGDIVFVGYGLVTPDTGAEAYDSYKDIDVEGKIVLMLHGVPQEVTPKRRQALNRYAGLRTKAFQARQHGAKAMLVVRGPKSPKAGEVLGLTGDRSSSDSGIVAASISGSLAEKITKSAGVDLAQMQGALDLEDPHTPGAIALKGVQGRLSVELKRIRETCQNVVAILPGEGELADEFVAVGAHYDHLGRGEAGGGLTGNVGEEIFNGADDNASGVATVMELAQHMAGLSKGKNRRSVIFAAWTGEELGLFGSEHFVQHPPVPMEKIVAYVNFDMVGRLVDNKLTVQGAGSSPKWRSMLEKRNIPAGFNLSIQDDPYLPTDAQAFYSAGAPVLAFFTGAHEDYHRPEDDADKLDYNGMERIAKFAEMIIADLATDDTAPVYAKVERQQSAARGGMRASTGTIPDYTAEVKGLKLKDVRAGGPADKAGIKGGDIIVQLGDIPINGIYDYTEALAAVKPDVETDIVVMRGDQRLELKITPEGR